MQSFIICFVVLFGFTTAHASYEEAMAHYKNHEYEDAYKKFRLMSKTTAPEVPDALYMLGSMDVEGKGTAKNPHTAHMHFKASAEKGHLGARYRLGRAYQTGELDIRPNFDEALKFYMAGIEPFDETLHDTLIDMPGESRQWLSGCYFGMGDIFQNGYDVVEKDSDLAKQAFQKCLDINDRFSEARKRLDALTKAPGASKLKTTSPCAACAEDLLSDDENYVPRRRSKKAGTPPATPFDDMDDDVAREKAWALLLSGSAEEKEQAIFELKHLSVDDPKADYYLYEHFTSESEQGIDAKDAIRAKNYLALAVEGGCPEALVEKATNILSSETLTPKKEKVAIKLLWRAKAKGNINAAIKLGDYHHAGLHGIEKNIKGALELYALAGKFAEEEADVETDGSNYGKDQVAHVSYKLAVAFAAQGRPSEAKKSLEHALSAGSFGITTESDIRSFLKDINSLLKK